MNIITDKKELLKVIGDWSTIQINSKYEMGSDQIQLECNGKQVIFRSDNIKDVAYIALQCHAITDKQYSNSSYWEYYYSKR